MSNCSTIATLLHRSLCSLEGISQHFGFIILAFIVAVRCSLRNAFDFIEKSLCKTSCLFIVGVVVAFLLLIFNWYDLYMYLYGANKQTKIFTHTFSNKTTNKQINERTNKQTGKHSHLDSELVAGYECIHYWVWKYEHWTHSENSIFIRVLPFYLRVICSRNYFIAMCDCKRITENLQCEMNVFCLWCSLHALHWCSASLIVHWKWWKFQLCTVPLMRVKLNAEICALEIPFALCVYEN